MDTKKSFLQQSYEDNWELYQETLDHKSATPPWDIFIITASSEEQAAAYRLQIEQRQKQGVLPSETRFMVIPDPEGKRIGSGGATLNALLRAAEEINTDSENSFSNQRVIIIHSGGDSKRIPQYSAFGKLFSKVPRELPDGRYSTLFDEFVIALSGLPSRMKEGVMIVSGDVLLLFNHNQIDLGRQGVVGISIKTPAETGSRHGVYLSDDDNRVKRFLHKMPEEVLKEKGAINQQGMVDIDTGLVWLDAEIASKLFNLISDNGLISKDNKDKYNKYINEKVRLNFYGDFLIPFTADARLEEYLEEESEGEECPELIEVRKEIWDKFKNDPMYVQSLSPAEFIHFGTTREFRELMKEVDREYSFLSWSKEVVSYNRDYRQQKPTVINSSLAEQVELGTGIVIEDSIIKTPSRIGQGAVISNIVLKEMGLELKANLVVHQLLVKKDGQTGFVTRVYGVYDNPKYFYQDRNASIMNLPYQQFFELMEIDEDDLWTDGEDKNLWQARLYPFCQDREESISLSLLLQEPGKMTATDKENWQKSIRLSLKDSYQQADQLAIIKQQLEIEDKVRVDQLIRAILQKDVYIKKAEQIIANSEQRLITRLNLLLHRTEQMDDQLKRMKLYRSLAEIISNNEYILQDNMKEIAVTVEDEEDSQSFYGLEDKAYQLLNKAISWDNKFSIHKILSYQHQAVTVRSAARVNFGGGWSDTPPYSIENGGMVLNAAIKLRDQLPIKVDIDVIDKPVIECISQDLNVQMVYRTKEKLMDYQDPSDPLALLKAAFVVSGLVDIEEEITLEERLKELGGGLRLSTGVAIPKGSGLGTSSILAGTVLKALSEVLGSELSEQKLFDRVLALEQLLTTGGGWQDQVGGLTGGIKLISSRPGIPQQIDLQPLKLSEKTFREFNERLVVIFTGQRRLAKRILRDIMGEYILNNPDTIYCLSQIQRIAVMMKFELEKGNIDGFAELMNDHWQLNKRLDPGSTNSYIDHIFTVCQPYMAGGKICGAGGGGFIQVLLKETGMKDPLKKDLQGLFQDGSVGIWESDITKNAIDISYR